jgi:pyrimidine operon attenuation protein/uracil phosphoribosyltransferase
VTAAAVQRIADLGADAEGEPRRPVPRLGDAALPDQLAVLVDDVLRTGDPAAVRAAAAELTALRAALGLPAR